MAGQAHYTQIRLQNGEVFTVEGKLQDVEKGLSDAARSGQGRLAWFKERSTGSPIGLNPVQVAVLRLAEVAG
jgi:hypothetical protein